ncbi:uncharacterized protein LOC119664864 [Teleopsis dalmanni]|uniref:uncharacterized protein LOC119664864 n=1 Tax=Teleopsis dalmanni TaxID=139649 RepID=UPI0018CDD528|nr:uncharacterized protein LOC119664864 [Teleopsis dalmanni]
MSGTVIRVEPLNAENYDTWKLQMKAILVKNDLWSYVEGTASCPTGEGAAKWISFDQKPCADIMLSVSASELRLIAECTNSKEMWMKLQATYSSKGPARKATLLKKVALSRMKEGEKVREHLNDFFETVVKLKEIDVSIGDELPALIHYHVEDAFISSIKENYWCLDSGCTAHLSANREYFTDFQKSNKVLNLANDNTTNINGVGKMKITVDVDGRDNNIDLKEVLYVEDLRTSLLSVSKIVDSGYEVHFRPSDAIVLDKYQKVITRAKRCGNLFIVENKNHFAQVAEEKCDIEKWYQKMGHINENDLKKLASYNLQYKRAVETFTGKRIKALQSDNGREYVNSEFNLFLRKFGIQRRLTAPYTPEQNGIAERKNRTLVEMARCMMKQAEVRPNFWAEALNTACYIRNRCPTKALNDVVPHKLWTGKMPTIVHFQVFGSKAYVLKKDKTRDKFDSKSEPYMFVGYSNEAKAYRLWSPTKRNITISRDVVFKPSVNPKIVENTDTRAENSIRRRGRPRFIRTNSRESSNEDDNTSSVRKITDENHSDDEPDNNVFEDCEMVFLITYQTPVTILEALESDETNSWSKALEDEMVAQLKCKMLRL